MKHSEGVAYISYKFFLNPKQKSLRDTSLECANLLKTEIYIKNLNFLIKRGGTKIKAKG